MPSQDLRAAWIGTCMFWFWAWLIGAIVWIPFTFGVSLLALLPAGGSFWLMWVPIGKTPTPQAYGPPIPPHYPPVPQLPPYRQSY